jgi:hypothetical protein
MACKAPCECKHQRTSSAHASRNTSECAWHQAFQPCPTRTSTGTTTDAAIRNSSSNNAAWNKTPSQQVQCNYSSNTIHPNNPHSGACTLQQRPTMRLS